jgi:hypothetical protein
MNLIGCLAHLRTALLFNRVEWSSGNEFELLVVASELAIFMLGLHGFEVLLNFGLAHRLHIQILLPLSHMVRLPQLFLQIESGFLLHQPVRQRLRKRHVLHRQLFVVLVPCSRVLQPIGNALLFCQLAGPRVVVLSQFVVFRNAARVRQQLVGVSDQREINLTESQHVACIRGTVDVRLGLLILVTQLFVLFLRKGAALLVQIRHRFQGDLAASLPQLGERRRSSLLKRHGSGELQGPIFALNGGKSGEPSLSLNLFLGHTEFGLFHGLFGVGNKLVDGVLLGCLPVGRFLA